MTLQADIIRNQRRLFAAPGGSHDRLVRFLATWLPAGIGMLAAVMILSPLAPRGEVSFLLDRNKVAIAKDRIRVDQAQYRGQDTSGRQFTVSAAQAVQESAKVPVVNMTGLVAEILLADGPARLTAGNGVYDFDKETISVDDKVTVTASDGYSMTSSGVTVDMKTQQVAGSGGVEGAIPAGTFSADRIEANLSERTVTLDGHARLRMAPGQIRMPQ